MSVRSINYWIDLVNELGEDFEKRSHKHDSDDSFVTENYNSLKEYGFLSALIPDELGGGGLTHSEMCDILRNIAQYCSSTALALSMHQHLLAANIWRYKHGMGMEEMLRNVAAKQPILVSTGANDWLDSSGEMKKVQDGYIVNAIKHFASQSAKGDILVTSSNYNDPEKGWQVLHFAVPLNSRGISLLDNWQALGMRGTGSNSVKLEDVFIPESSVTLRRPKGEYHPVWNVILTVAMPLIMSVYLGIAQKAAKIALKHASTQTKNRNYLPDLIGSTQNQLSIAELCVNDMIRIANNFDFEAIDKNGNDILVRKTNSANACIAVVEKAMEIVGGQGFYRGFGLEKLFRDIQAAKYHPLQEREQLKFTGDYLLRKELESYEKVMSN